LIWFLEALLEQQASLIVVPACLDIVHWLSPVFRIEHTLPRQPWLFTVISQLNTAEAGLEFRGRCCLNLHMPT
jgi:hypothetical protein